MKFGVKQVYGYSGILLVQQVAVIKKGQRAWQLDPLPNWAGQILKHVL
jgi:hypothetical protein